MYYRTTTNTISFLLTLATLAKGQSISDLPSCATAGALSAIASTNCTATDISCICKSTTFTTALQTYAKANCSAADYNTAVATGQSICAAAGVSVVGTDTSSQESSITPDAAFSATTTGFDVSAPQTSTADTTAGVPSVSASADANATSTERCGCEDDNDDMPSNTASAAVGVYTGAAARGVGVGKEGFRMMMGLAIVGGAFF